jgi:hypothetical protein
MSELLLISGEHEICHELARGAQFGSREFGRRYCVFCKVCITTLMLAFVVVRSVHAVSNPVHRGLINASYTPASWSPSYDELVLGCRKNAYPNCSCSVLLGERFCWIAEGLMDAKQKRTDFDLCSAVRNREMNRLCPALRLSSSRLSRSQKHKSAWLDLDVDGIGPQCSAFFAVWPGRVVDVNR